MWSRLIFGLLHCPCRIDHHTMTRQTLIAQHPHQQAQGATNSLPTGASSGCHLCRQWFFCTLPATIYGPFLTPTYSFTSTKFSVRLCTTSFLQLESSRTYWCVLAPGCSTVATGRWLALPPLVQLVGNFVVAGLESVMIGRGWSTLSIRKIVTMWGSLVSSAAICMFGCSKTELAATLWYCVALAGTCLHGSGWSANYLEVGGEDTALLNGVGAGRICCFIVALSAYFGQPAALHDTVSPPADLERFAASSLCRQHDRQLAVLCCAVLITRASKAVRQLHANLSCGSKSEGTSGARLRTAWGCETSAYGAGATSCCQSVVNRWNREQLSTGGPMHRTAARQTTPPIDAAITLVHSSLATSHCMYRRIALV